MPLSSGTVSPASLPSGTAASAASSCVALGVTHRMSTGSSSISARVIRLVKAVIRLLVLAATVYVGLGFVLFLARNRIIFPIHGGPAGEPAQFGISDGQAIAIATADGAHLAGWFLPASPAPAGGGRAPALV